MTTLGPLTIATARADRHVVVEETAATDATIQVWHAVDGDGPSVQLTPAQARQLAEDLLARVDHIEDRSAQ